MCEVGTVLRECRDKRVSSVGRSPDPSGEVVVGG